MGLCASAPRQHPGLSDSAYANNPELRRRIEEGRRRARAHHEQVDRDTRRKVRRSGVNPVGGILDELARRRRQKARDKEV